MSKNRRRVRVVFVPGVAGTALAFGGKVFWGRDEMLDNLVPTSVREGADWAATLEVLPLKVRAGLKLFSMTGTNYRDVFYALMLQTDGQTDSGGVTIHGDDPTSLQDGPLTKFDWTLAHEQIREDPYSKVINALNDPVFQGHIDLRIFGYDWRLSNAYNAELLGGFIRDQWSLDNPPIDSDDRVTIVAHSMGGLLSRYFIESADLAGHQYVKRLITVGTPHLGAPVVYEHMLGISVPLPDIQARLMNKARQGEMMLRFDSFAEMLPVYDFLSPNPWSQSGSRERWRDWLSAIKLTRSETPGLQGPTRTVDALEVVLRFRSALVPPNSLQSWLAWRRVQYVLLGGLGLDTLTSVSESTTYGDTTVPYISALNFAAVSDVDRRLDLTPKDQKDKRELLYRLARVRIEKGKQQLPPLIDTFWLKRRAWGDHPAKPKPKRDRPSTDAPDGASDLHHTIDNSAGTKHQDALRIPGVVREVTSHLSLARDRFGSGLGPPTWAVLWKHGMTVARMSRKDTDPTVLCVAQLTLNPPSGAEEPPFDYAISHRLTTDPLPGVSYRGIGEIDMAFSERIEKEDLPLVGIDRAVDVVPYLAGLQYLSVFRCLLIDRQTIERSTHRFAAAILMDLDPSENNVYLASWNTGDMDAKKNVNRNGFHAEAHLVAWLRAQPMEWRNRLASISIVQTMSPCKLCCGDLRWLAGRPVGTNPTQPGTRLERFDPPRPPNLVSARIAWHSIYPIKRLGDNGTRAEDISDLLGNTTKEKSSAQPPRQPKSEQRRRYVPAATGTSRNWEIFETQAGYRGNIDFNSERPTA